jgi:hypothetical protein
MRLQHEKCAYCERKLASEDHGGPIEHDLEHFRPKNGVEVWPSGPAYTFATGTRSGVGYYWLSYHLLNYCTTCKKCNTPKSNYFPIAARRGRTMAEPANLLLSESPFLIYPLGDVDEDPEDLIRFVGIKAVPKVTRGTRRLRAEITIEFFQLNGREELRRGRAEVLCALDNAFGILESNPTAYRKRNAEGDIRRLRSAESHHASCVRCACDLYARDRAGARRVFEEARDLLGF